MTHRQPFHASTRWLLFLLFLLLPLSGCGFHLKGYQQVSPILNGLYVVDGERRDTLAGLLQRNLRSAGVKLAADEASAKYRLQITHEQIHSRVLSVDGSGKALDSELELQAAFRLSQASGEAPVEEQLELLRQLSYSGTDELAQRNESALLSADMRSDMANQIIRLLQARLK